MQHYLEFRALGNSVIGTLDSGMVAQGYSNEMQAIICTCASVPDWIAEDVAREIARLLNEAQPVLPYKDATKHIRQEARHEDHTD